MAYFYFNFRNINKQNRRNLLPSLISLLSFLTSHIVIVTYSMAFISNTVAAHRNPVTPLMNALTPLDYLLHESMRTSPWPLEYTCQAVLTKSLSVLWVARDWYPARPWTFDFPLSIPPRGKRTRQEPVPLKWVRVQVNPQVQIPIPTKNPYPPSGYRFLAGMGLGTPKSTQGLPVQFTIYNVWQLRSHD